MTSKEKTEMILEAMRSEVAAFVESQGQIESATEYEDELLKIARKFASELAIHSSSKNRQGRNAKKKF